MQCPGRRLSLRTNAEAVLVGLLSNALIRFEWLEPAAALVVAAVAVKEGGETWRGEGGGRGLLSSRLRLQSKRGPQSGKPGRAGSPRRPLVGASWER
jgi:hypothetical protein